MGTDSSFRVPALRERVRSRRTLGLLLLMVVPFALNWRLVLAAPQDQVHLCCDFPIYHYPAYLEGQAWLSSGTFPQWFPPGNLGGQHLAADPLRGFLYPPNWLVYGVGSLIGPQLYLRVVYAFLVAHVVIGGIATALFARSFADLEWRFAVLAGLAFETAGYINVYIVGPPQIIGFTLAPAVLYAWHRSLKRDDIRFTGVTAVLLGFSLLGGYHFTPAFVVGPAMIGVLLYRDPPWNTPWPVLKRHWTWIGLTVVLSLGLFAVQAVPSYVAYQSSFRTSVASLTWNSAYNFGFESFYQLLLPSMAGEYWIGYVGLLPLAMLVIAAYRPDLRDTPITFSLLMALLGLGLATGIQTLLQQWAYFTVPGLGRWRSIHHYFLWFVIFGSVTTGAVAQRIDRAVPAEDLLRQLRKAIPFLIAPTALITVSLMTVRTIVGGGTLRGIPIELTAVVHSWVVFTFMLAIVVAALYTYAGGRDDQYILILVAVLLVGAGLHIPLMEQRHDASPAAIFEHNNVTETLSNATEESPPSRVIFHSQLPYRHYAGPYEFHPVRSYDPLPPPEQNRLVRIMQAHPDAFNIEFRVTNERLNLTNDSGWHPYAQVNSEEGYWQRDERIWRQSESSVWVYRNPDAFSRAFAVDRVVTAPTKGYRSQLETMDGVDPRRTAVVDPGAVPSWVPQNQSLGNGSVDVVGYSQNEVTLRTDTTGPTFVLITDAYHPWWTATIDGEKTTIVRADARFRGVFVPAGTHEVRLQFDRTPFYLGGILSLLALLGASALILYPHREALLGR
ncbi:hypothetical protein [Salinibaculum rarum]|uniref:hypothetical protein n=1 Tax=Salinibaculum rarum TaxID=3058903 RepID=UPI00265E93A8|nr:hypothetical protein [Salinibaculum sp. KK48]